MNEQVRNRPTRLVLTGWEPGMQKIAVTQAIRDAAGYGLKQAKDCTDAVLDGKEVVIDDLEPEKLEMLAATLRELGVLVRAE